VADPYPLPTVEDMHSSMAGCTLWSQLDAVTGFWQVPVAEEDVPKTGFTTPFGNFEWTRMPMGMVSSPSTFQRLMDQMLAGVEGARTYVDDTFCFTDGFEQQLRVLDAVLSRVREYGVLLQPSKCSFCVERVVCLGHVVDKSGVRPVDDKVAAIVQLPQPRTVRALKGFLGMMGFYRKFIKDYARIVAPLDALTRRNVAYNWDAAATAAFETLKEALCSAPVLALPNWSLPFILTTDWSCGAIGAVLSQLDPETGDEHPVAFASRALTGAERNYGATEGECLAVKWAVEKFRYFLHGRRFTLRTDHQALKWLDSARFTNSKLERWALALQQYDFTVEYIKGETNVVADHLSRVHSCVVLGCAYAVTKVPLLTQRVRQAGFTCVTDAVVARVAAGTAWPSEAARQSDLDDVACSVCQDPGGADNMVVCSGCSQCYHLRCIVPAMSTVPTGDWYCPGCDPLFRNFDELCDPNPVLAYRPSDPYLHDALLTYVRCGCDESVLAAVAPGQAASLRRRAASLKPHPRLADWLLVCVSRGEQQPRWLTCPPVEYRWDLIRCMHDALGHAGVKQTVAYMRQYFHWCGLHEDVAAFVQRCDSCQRRKLLLPPPPALQPPIVHGPFEHVHIDLCGPFETPILDAQGRITRPDKPLKAHVVIMVDYFTKAAEFAVVYDKSAAAVAKAFYYSWICRYFVPSHVTSDNGTEFESEFEHMLARLGIHHIHTSAAHPASNGAVERVVKSFKAMLNAHVNAHPQHWVQSIPVVRMQYWSRLHAALGMSPHEMVFGRQPRPALPLGGLVAMAAQAAPVVSVVADDCPQPFEHVMQLQQQLLGYDADVFQKIQTQFFKNSRHWPLRHSSKDKRTQSQPLRVGDWVLEVVSGPVPALHEGVRGPYLIVGFTGAEKEVALLQTGGTAFKAPTVFKRHVGNLSKYYAKHHMQR
jgi:hypothetical protein